MKHRGFGFLFGLVVWMVAGAGAAVAAPAPANTGLLAVTPVNSNGVLLVNANGSGQRQICPASGACTVSGAAEFAPDGRSLLVQSTTGADLIDLTGDCIDCHIDNGVSPAFAPGGTEITEILHDGSIREYGIDGIQKASLPGRPFTDAVLSSTGLLAAVRGGKVWLGQPGHLHSIGKGADPVWSPNSSEVAYTEDGSVEVWSDGKTRRVIAGSAPAFSPNGRSLAYIGSGSRVETVAVSGGTPHAVGDVRGTAVTWQPVATTRATCTVPPGSTVIAQSDQGVVTQDEFTPKDGDDTPDYAYMGCLSSTGQSWLLERYNGNNIDGSTSVSLAAANGNYAALVLRSVDTHYPGPGDDTVATFDLTNGHALPNSNQIHCPSAVACGQAITQIVLTADGNYAIDGTFQEFDGTVGGSWSDSVIADDNGAVRILDQAALPASTSPMISGLTLSGNNLTWQDNGNPMSATLS